MAAMKQPMKQPKARQMTVLELFNRAHVPADAQEQRSDQCTGSPASAGCVQYNPCPTAESPSPQHSVPKPSKRCFSATYEMPTGRMWVHHVVYFLRGATTTTHNTAHTQPHRASAAVPNCTWTLGRWFGVCGVLLSWLYDYKTYHSVHTHRSMWAAQYAQNVAWCTPLGKLMMLHCTPSTTKQQQKPFCTMYEEHMKQITTCSPRYMFSHNTLHTHHT